MKIGVIGHGHISKHYFAAAKEINDFDIVAVCDINPLAFGNLTADIPQYTDIRDLLKDPNVDAVIVSVPTLLHSSVARTVLEGRKPLLLEKPATVSRNEFDALEKMAHDAQVPVVILFHYIRASEVLSAVDYVRSNVDKAHISWHASTYDPYNTNLNLSNFSLCNTWVDSGINQLSLFLTLWPDAKLTLRHAALTPPTGSSIGTVSATACFGVSGSVHGMAVFEVNWALGIDQKTTRLDASPQIYVSMDHSEETLSVYSSGREKKLKFSTKFNRLTNHYIKLFPKAIEQLAAGKSNWEFARAVHTPFFDVLERVGFK